MAKVVWEEEVTADGYPADNSSQPDASRGPPQVLRKGERYVEIGGDMQAWNAEHAKQSYNTPTDKDWEGIEEFWKGLVTKSARGCAGWTSGPQNKRLDFQGLCKTL